MRLCAALRRSWKRRPLSQAFQRRNLAEELLPWLRWAAKHNRTRRNIANHAGLGAHLRATSNGNVASERSLAADLNEVLQHRRPGNTNLRHDDTALAQADVVTDLHQIIEARARTNHRVPHRAPVDGGVRTYFDVVLDQHPA